MICVNEPIDGTISEKQPYILSADLHEGENTIRILNKSTNEEIYNNLKKLGASSAWLQKTARRQVSRVFLSPVTIGTFLILAFYLLILAANGENGITPYGWAGFGLCMTIVAAISSLIYGLYRATLKTVYRKLKIEG